MIEELAAGFPILSCLLLLPLVGAAVLWLVDDEDMVRTSALTISLVELALAVFVLLRFVPDSAAMQFAEHVRWIVGDVTRATDIGEFDLWHDRAVFHFLTTGEDRRAYVNLAARTVRQGGFLIMSTFATDGPKKCSGLDTCQ